MYENINHIEHTNKNIVTWVITDFLYIVLNKITY